MRRQVFKDASSLGRGKNTGTYIGASVFGGIYLILVLKNSGLLQADYYIAFIFGFALSVSVGAEIGGFLWRRLKKNEEG